MWISKLEARTRRPNESIADLGDDLRRLAQRAYSNMNHEAREMLALIRLYKSVSPYLKYKCISENSTAVTKAVSIIETYEGILGEEPRRKRLSVRHCRARQKSAVQWKGFKLQQRKQQFCMVLSGSYRAA